MKHVELSKALYDGFAPPDRRGIADWAADNVVLDGAYAIKGPFDVSPSRHLLKPFEFFQDETVRQVNILKGIQTAGSLFVDVSFQWMWENRPGDALWLFQSDDDALQHWSSRIESTFLKGPLRERFEKSRKRREHFKWTHMNFWLSGANVGSVQSKSILYLFMDEVWMYKQGIVLEAIGRTEFYKDRCKITCVSQAGFDGDDWQDMCESGEWHNWNVKCQDCAEYFPLDIFQRMKRDRNEYAGLVYEKGVMPNGDRDFELAARTAKVKCPHCGHEHPDTPATKVAFNESGDYLIEKGSSDTEKTLRWTSLVGGNYGSLAKEYVQALNARDKGNLEPLKKFYQKKAVEFWKEELSKETIEIVTSDYVSGDALSTADFNFVTIDQQDGVGNDTEHFWLRYRQWWINGKSRGILFQRCESLEEIDLILKEYKIPAGSVYLDGGNGLTTMASYARPRGWTLLLGRDDEFFVVSLKGRRSFKRAYSKRDGVDASRGKRGAGRGRKVPYYKWSNPAIKDILQSYRDGLARPWEVEADVSEIYIDGMDSERKVSEFSKRYGKNKYIWKAFKKNNHPWDCECMQIVLAMRAGVIPDDMDFSDREPEQEEEEAVPVRKRVEPPHRKKTQLEMFV